MNNTAVVITTWNRKKTLRRTLNSFWKYNGRDQDIIVTDNGSTDGTFDSIQEFDLSVIRNQKNLGIQMGMYTGLKGALDDGYKFILYIEDDFPSINRVPFEELADFLDRKPDVGYIKMNDKRYRKKHIVTKKPIEYYGYEEFDGFKLRMSNYHWSNNPAFFRSEFVREIGSCKNEIDMMKKYHEIYKYQAQIEPPSFHTVPRTKDKRKGWKD